MRTSIAAAAVGAGIAAWLAGSPATAQDYQASAYSGQGEIGQSDRAVHPPRNAFELSVRGGYNQGFGRFSGRPGGSVANVTDAGGNVEIVPSYRINPRSSVGVLVQGGQYNSDQPDTTVRSLATGLDYTFHIRPGERADPWVSAGVGYRFLSLNPGNAPNTLLHGFQLARLTIGLDAVVTDDIAFGPYAGADLTMFLWQVGPGDDGQIPENGRVSTFISAGLSGRFDIGGTRDRGTVSYVGKL